MIKDGMWFENEAGYQRYLKRCAAIKKKYSHIFKDLYDPLIKRAKELLRESGRLTDER